MVHRDCWVAVPEVEKGNICLQEETQLQEPTEAAKCADVQEPLLKREPHRSVKQPLETARKKVSTSIITD